MTDPFRLDGRTALVTGGTSGIGRAIAELFADRGAAVVVCGRDADRGAAFTVETGITFVRADVIVEDDVRALLGACEGLSVLVNNAGPTDLLHSRTVDGPVGMVTPVNWARVVEQTLTSAYLVTHCALPALIGSGSSAVINITSTAAAQVVPGFDAYAAAKSGLEALTRSTAVAYAHLGVRANALRVGSIAVDHGDGDARRAISPDLRPDAWRRAEPPRAGSPADVAHAALFLAVPASGYITGAVLPVDGGLEVRSLMPWQTPRPEAP